MALNADDLMSAYRPFSHHWLDSAVQESLLPGSPWQQIYDKLSQVLAKRIQPELSDRDKRAAIFDMLGSEFLQKYLSKWTWDKPTQDLESRSPAERKVILQATQLLLKEKLDQAATDCGYLVSKNKSGSSSSLTLSSPPPAPVQVPEEVIDTISQMDAIFRAGMHRYLVQEGMTVSPGFDPSHTTSPQLTHLHGVQPGPNPRALSPMSIPSSTASGSHDDDITTTTTPIPNCWGQTSDLLGKSLCAILRRDPGRLDEVCRKLLGRQLPGSLRHKVWNEIMLRNYKEAYQGEKSSEWFLRQNFAKTVMRGKAELAITMTTNSPINGLLETAVQEKYSNTPCLLKHRERALPKQAREALNILYVFDRSYQPYFIHWLYPLNLALMEKSKGDTQGPDDLPYELALQLHLLRSYTFPRWSEVLAVAQDVMQITEREDPEFFNHLMNCSKTNVKLDPKDFLVHQIQEEQQRALSLTAHVPSDPVAAGSDEDRQMLASPLMFLRKWLGEGFVGVCDTQAVLFMWDQCFMSGWSHQVLSRLCLSLLMLLRKNFMETAQDYHVMKQIFASEPCRLYTLDIQKAFQHLQNEGSVMDVPSLNRRPLARLEKKTLSPPVTLDPTHYAPLTHTRSADLPNIQPSSLPSHKHLVSPQPSAIATPTSIAPPISKATPSKAAPPITKPSLQPPASKIGEQRDIPSLRPSLVSQDAPEAEVRSSHTSLQCESKVGSLDRAPSLPPVDDEPAWMTFDLGTSSDLPAAPSPKEGFDLYIDCIRFLPDNATIVKVTVSGRFTKEGQNVPLDLYALPDLTSRSRCPEFTYRARFEYGRPDQLMEIRVWTVDRYTHQLVVMGVCLLKVYNERSKKLNIGGYQLRLRSGYPASRPPILPHALDHLPAVPGCSILLRLLPLSEDFSEAPSYNGGFYQSDACKPTESETNVIQHYKAKQNWGERVKETALALAKSEDGGKSTSVLNKEHGPETASDPEENKMADPWSKMSDGDLSSWMLKRLQAKDVPPESLHPLLEIDRCIDYQKGAGVAIKIRAAFGLQADKCYSIVLTRLLRGPAASRQTSEIAADGRSNRLEAFLTKEMDLDSLMKAPRWKDKAMVLRPIYDEKSVLLLQFFGLEVVYKVDPSGLTKGVVQSPKGKGHLSLDNSSTQGWSLLPIFDRKCAIQGTFVIPIFQNKDKPFLKGLMDAPSLESWMRVSVKKKLIQVHSSHPSAIVSMWDGHFYHGQHVPLPRRDYFLDLAGDFNKFSRTSQDKSGNPLNQIVLRSLPSAVQSEGLSGEKYLQEKQNFEETMHDIVTELMEDALLATGQAPLTAGS